MWFIVHGNVMWYATVLPSFSIKIPSLPLTHLSISVLLVLSPGPGTLKYSGNVTGVYGSLEKFNRRKKKLRENGMKVTSVVFK